jgi:multidrug resistance efflux pump
MRYLFLLLISPLIVVAKVHYAKVEPYESITLKSAVSAQVMSTKRTLEGRVVYDETIIQLDHKLDKIDLQSTESSLKLIQNMIKTNQKILTSLKESLQRHNAYYQRIESLSTASKTQKDNAFYGYINTKTQYFSTKEKIDSLRKQQLDLSYKIELLRDRIGKKKIKLSNKFLDKLLVNAGDFVNPGTPLAKIKDLSRAKLVLFLEQEEIEEIKKRAIYLNGEKTDYKIDKIWSVTDEKFISSYRAEIVIKPNHNFSELLKVEFR